MSYASLDPTIKNWATAHSLTIFTVYKDVEVRSVELINPRGKRCQIWVDPPDALGRVGVHAWDYRKMTRDSVVQMSELSTSLEDIYTWCQSL
jgi:hypothetical protein